MEKQVPPELMSIEVFVGSVADFAEPMVRPDCPRDSLRDPDSDLIVDWGLDSLGMLCILDALSEIVGPDGILGFDPERMGTSLRSLYLYCLESLQRPPRESLQTAP